MNDGKISCCKFCQSSLKDLTQGLGLCRNLYCTKCGSHFYEKVDSGLNPTKVVSSRWFTKDEWEKYVNDFSEN